MGTVLSVYKIGFSKLTMVINCSIMTILDENIVPTQNIQVKRVTELADYVSSPVVLHCSIIKWVFPQFANFFCMLVDHFSLCELQALIYGSPFLFDNTVTSENVKISFSVGEHCYYGNTVWSWLLMLGFREKGGG